MKKSILGLVAVISTLTAAAASTDWYTPTIESRPFVRWWWLGSAVDSVGLTYNLEEFARQGLGGVEITPIYGVKGNEINDIPYLSPRWMRMLGHVEAESRRLGLQVDMNNGTGWPFGGPDTSTDFSARKRVVEKWNALPGEKVEYLMVASDKRQRPVATLQKVIAVDNSGKRRLDITGNVCTDSVLRWTAPKGKDPWTVYGIFSGRTFQKVKRAAPGGEGLVLNHYDSVAVRHYLNRFDQAFADADIKWPDTFFNDSYEVYGSDWADNILEVFERDHGYRLEMYIPEFLDQDNHTGLRPALVRDYRATLAGMLTDNFTRVWTDWAHERGSRIRNQSHGSPANIIDLYAMVDIPECESFGQTDFDIPGLAKHGPSRPSDADPAVLKFASSAAHLTGKRLTSAETLTWLTEHFCTSLARCKPELDQMLASGVNHTYFHGAPYSPKGAEFPGWMFYASINMSPTNTIWRDSDSLFSYLTRCQSFLSAGKPDNDFLLYFPLEDVWAEQGGNPYLMFDIHKMQQRMPRIKQAVNDVIDAGYDCDYLSDSLLSTLSVDRGAMITAPGGAAYSALIVPAVNIIDPATFSRMTDLARGGATLVVTGHYPAKSPGMKGAKEGESAMRDLLKHLPATDFTSVAVHPLGQGRIITAPDIHSALKATGVRPETGRTEQGLRMMRRRNEAGGHNYFVALLQDRPVDGWVTLSVPAASAMIFDPLTGRRGLAETRAAESGTEVRLQLAPGESALIKTFPEAVSAEPWPYIEAKGTPVLLDSDWKFAFEGDSLTSLGSLRPWTDTQLPGADTYAGTGIYETTFTLPEATGASDWMLDLGDVRESADVTINGVPAGKAWCVPFTLRVGHLLRPGENTIRIAVTNLQANRIADYERRGVKWRIFKDANIASVTNAKTFSFADWPVAPSGLASQVRLIPLTLSTASH